MLRAVTQREYQAVIHEGARVGLVTVFWNETFGRSRFLPWYHAEVARRGPDPMGEIPFQLPAGNVLLVGQGLHGDPRLGADRHGSPAGALRSSVQPPPGGGARFEPGAERAQLVVQRLGQRAGPTALYGVLLAAAISCALMFVRPRVARLFPSMR